MTIMRFSKILSFVIAATMLAVGNSFGPEVWASSSAALRGLSCAALVVCFGYLHYGFHMYLLPIRSLSDTQKNAALTAIRSGYKSSFFFSTVLAGYIGLLLSVLPIAFPTANSIGEGFFFGALALVALGTGAKARVLVLHLAYLVKRLRKGDQFENLCAFEVLEMICWEYYIDTVPNELLDLADGLPPKIVDEIPGDAEVDQFSGTTIGEWFRAVFSGSEICRDRSKPPKTIAFTGMNFGTGLILKPPTISSI